MLFLGLFLLVVVAWGFNLIQHKAVQVELARIHLILLALHYLEANTPKLEYYLPNEIKGIAGGVFGIWYKWDLEAALRHMEKVQLVTSRISQRELAKTMNSDTPKEYRMMQAGRHTLEYGPPKALRPPAGSIPRGPTSMG